MTERRRRKTSQGMFSVLFHSNFIKIFLIHFCVFAFTEAASQKNIMKFEKLILKRKTLSSYYRSSFHNEHIEN